MGTPPQAPGRIVPVDALRGLTMAAMIVVNNPGTWSHMHPWLRHAAWGEPLLPADLVFPMFLFLVGVSVPLALGRRRDAGAGRAALAGRALRRAGVLFLLGVALNLFPQFDLSTVRIPGVLQRIALVFLGCVLAWLAWRPRGVALAAMALVAGYTALLARVPVPGAGGPLVAPGTSLPVWLDERLLGAHTWRGPGDPEGLLSTLPALATGLLGVLAGERLRTRGPGPGSARLLAGAAVACLAAGWLAARWQPPHKELWNATYVLQTGGWSLLLLALALRAGPMTPPPRALAPALVLGRHALTAYVAAHLLSDLTIGVLRWPDGAGGTLSLHHLLQRHLWASWLPPRAASLAQSLALLAVITAALAWRERRTRRRGDA